MVHYLMLWALQQMDGVHYLILWGQRIGPLPNPSVMGEMNPNKKKTRGSSAPCWCCPWRQEVEAICILNTPWKSPETWILNWYSYRCRLVSYSPIHRTNYYLVTNYLLRTVYGSFNFLQYPYPGTDELYT